MEVSPMIARNWRNLKRPRGINLVIDEERYGKYVAEPLERGYGYTIGNALKRILLSSVKGTSIVACKVQRINSEGAIAGISESFETLKLNLKELDLWREDDDPLVIRCDVSHGEVYAKDLILPEGITIFNPDLYLFKVTGQSQVVTMEIHNGYGYKVAEEHQSSTDGLYPIDAMFSPIKRVSYQVSNARIGQRTDYDKLSLEVWTNGALTPQDAIIYSAKLFREQMTSLINFEEEEELPIVEEEQDELPPFHEYLDMRVSELDLPVRAANCLRSANITYIGELVQRNEKDMVDIKNFGRKSLTDINEVLSHRGLSLGMQISDWAPPE